MTLKDQNSKIIIFICYKKYFENKVLMSLKYAKNTSNFITVIKRLIWLKARQQQMKALEAQATLVPLKNLFYPNFCDWNFSAMHQFWVWIFLSSKINEYLVKNQKMLQNDAV